MFNSAVSCVLVNKSVEHIYSIPVLVIVTPVRGLLLLHPDVTVTKIFSSTLQTLPDKKSEGSFICYADIHSILKYIAYKKLLLTKKYCEVENIILYIRLMR